MSKIYTITDLGVLSSGDTSVAEDISVFGDVIVGYSNTSAAGTNQTAWRATVNVSTGVPSALTAMSFLTGGNTAQAEGISRNGLVFSGFCNKSGGAQEAVTWTNAGAVTALSDLGHGQGVCEGGVSADGSIIFGSAYNASSNPQAVYWVNGTINSIALLTGGSLSQLNSCSADGAFAVGIADIADRSQRAVYWTATTGLVRLPELTDAGFSEAEGISADGTTIVGICNDTDGNRKAVIWTKDTKGAWQITDLGTLGGVAAQAFGVSPDGSIVTGAAGAADGQLHAFYWTAADGMVALPELAAYAGGTLSDTNSWSQADNVSQDGRFLVGTSGNSSGKQRAALWVLKPSGVPVTPTVFDPPAFDNLAMVTGKSAQPYWVERLTKMFDSGDSLQDAWFLDGGVLPTAIKDQGTGVKLYGLWHLRNQTVTVWLAGVDCGDFTVASDGTVTVPYAGSFTQNAYWGSALKGVVGYTYTSQGQLLRPMLAQDAGAANGPALGKTRRLHMWTALFVNTIGVSVGTLFSSLRKVIFKTPGGIAYPATEMFNGVHQNTNEDDYDFDGMLCWQVTRPYPVTISTIGGFIHTQDR